MGGLVAFVAVVVPVTLITVAWLLVGMAAVLDRLVRKKSRPDVLDVEALVAGTAHEAPRTRAEAGSFPYANLTSAS